MQDWSQKYPADKEAEGSIVESSVEEGLNTSNSSSEKAELVVSKNLASSPAPANNCTHTDLDLSRKSNSLELNLSGPSCPSFTRRMFALFIDTALMSVVSLLAIQLLEIFLNNCSYYHSPNSYGIVFLSSRCACLFSIFAPWLNLFNIWEMQRLMSQKPSYNDHLLEMLIAWTVVLLNLVSNLTYHSLMTSSILKGTIGQKCLGIEVLNLEGKPVSLFHCIYRSALKLSIWTYCSLFYWAVLATLFAKTTYSRWTLLTVWCLSVIVIILFDKTKLLYGAKCLLQYLWQKVSGTMTQSKK